MRDRCGRIISSSTPMEEPDVEISDQQKACYGYPKDRIRSVKEPTRVPINEYEAEGKDHIAQKHPPESRHDSRP
jgi:hypothetical protein